MSESNTPSSASSLTQPSTPSPSPICTSLHALYCFDVLSARFEGRHPIDPPFENGNESYALFVTWNTTSHRSKPSLRGCIGNFSPMPLAKGLREYALVSALEDHRFSPIKASELPSLSCNVSLLTPFTPSPDPLGWTPGIHGIHLTFPHPSSSFPSFSGHSRSYSATYLPEVCTDQGWSREECVKSAIAKAGYRGKVEVGDEVWRSLRVKVYGSEKAGIGYTEYVSWRKG